MRLIPPMPAIAVYKPPFLAAPFRPGWSLPNRFPIRLTLKAEFWLPRRLAMATQSAMLISRPLSLLARSFSLTLSGASTCSAPMSPLPVLSKPSTYLTQSSGCRTAMLCKNAFAPQIG